MSDNYNNYNLFRWNDNNIHYINNDNNYTDVYLNTGTVVTGQWENSISVIKINDNYNLIPYSNHFTYEFDYHNSFKYFDYNSKYKIFDNIVRNFLIIKNEKSINYDYYNDIVYFNMLSPFSFSNSGHDLSIILDMVDYIKNNNIKNILIFKNYKNCNNFKLIELLLPDSNFIELDYEVVYKIKNIIIIPQTFMNITKHSYLIDELKNTIINLYSETYNDCKNKNIVLMKTNRNKNVMLSYTQIHCEKLLSMLENDNYIVIIPEEINIYKLCIYLMYANKIIFSEGSVIYTNKIFIDKNIKHIQITPLNISVNCYHTNEYNKGLKLEYNNNILTDKECIDFYNKIISY